MLRPFLLLSFLVFGTILQGAAAQEGAHHNRVDVRHIEAGGIGYNQGYTTLETFISTDSNEKNVIPFLDLRGHIFNDGKWAANGGAGIRAIWGCRAYGINAYYDYRATNHKGYNQASVGLETLGELCDFRVNGYLPFGRKISNPYQVTYVSRKFEYAMKGIDGEAGFHFGKTRDFDFYAAAGPYYFAGEMGKGAIGGKARVAVYYKEYITAEISDSYDTVFHNHVQGQLTFSLPFGPRTKLKRSLCGCSATPCPVASVMSTRMAQPVGRQEIIVLDTHKKK